jgi:hypothetical protein
MVKAARRAGWVVVERVPKTAPRRRRFLPPFYTATLISGTKVAVFGLPLTLFLTPLHRGGHVTDCHLFWRLARLRGLSSQTPMGAQFGTPPPTTRSVKYCKQQSENGAALFLPFCPQADVGGGCRPP